MKPIYCIEARETGFPLWIAAGQYPTAFEAGAGVARYAQTHFQDNYETYMAVVTLEEIREPTDAELDEMDQGAESEGHEIEALDDDN